MLQGYTRKFKPLEILTDEQVEVIHKGILGILWETGATFHHNKALKLFENNGCKVDFEEKRVHFPPSLVEECLRKTPSSFHMKARDPKNNLLIGGNTLHLGVGPGMQALDMNTWEMRPATREENYNAVTILDALESVHRTSDYSPYFGFDGVPPAMSMLESDAARIRNSTKVTGFAYSNDSEIYSIQMAQAVGTEATGNFHAASPLSFYTDAIEACFRFVEAGFPLNMAGGPVMGGTVPATYAGGIIVASAELMSGLVLAQLIKPGAKLLPNDAPYPQNMQTGAPGFGRIGCSIHKVMFNQIWRKYQVTIANANSAYTNAKSIDFQDGYERAMALLLSALSGANTDWFIGAVYAELTFSPIQAILDDDIAGMIGRFLDGVEVSDETMAIDLINEVGPIPGFYLNKAHTRNWWHKEQFVPKAADRLTYPEWAKTGRRNCIDYARERMEEILATHKVSPPLTPGQEEDIERILTEARQYYRKNGQISDAEWEVYMKDLKSPNYPYG